MKNLRVLLILSLGVACSFSLGCGGGSSHTNVITTSGANVAPITVNTGPSTSGFLYANGAFTSVTVCVHGTSTCQTIDEVLVDTGSPGLRIVSSALTIALPQQKTATGNPVVECLAFVASYTWGPVQTADVQIAGEKASSVPVQVLSDTDFTVPSACASSGMNNPVDTVQSLGANGILGVGLAAQDCGPSPECVTTGSAGLYYECPSQNCATTGTNTPEALAQQVVNPVALFPTDNNGVIVELPGVSGAEASVSGSLVFGIGTQSNNGIGRATVYTTDAFGNFTTSYNGQAYSSSFIDSGSNGYFFLDSSVPGVPPTCADNSGFYCPNSTTPFSVTNQGNNGAKGTIKFSVANADNFFNTGDAAFGDLGGKFSGAFDWGLPFFYGRNVFVAIEGASTPGGSGPYWAY
jgi:hypothetical protein